MIPAPSYRSFSSSADLNSPESLTPITQLTFLELGMCPPLSALTSLPEYSSGDLVSQTIFEGSSIDSIISSIPAIMLLFGEDLNL